MVLQQGDGVVVTCLNPNLLQLFGLIRRKMYRSDIGILREARFCFCFPPEAVRVSALPGVLESVRLPGVFWKTTFGLHGDLAVKRSLPDLTVEKMSGEKRNKKREKTTKHLNVKP